MRTNEQNAAELDFFKSSPIEPGLKALGFRKVEAHKAKNGKTESESWERNGTKLKTFKARSGDWMWTCHTGTPPNDRGGKSGTIVHIASYDTGSLGRARIRLREIYGDVAGDGPIPDYSASSPAPSSSPSSPSAPRGRSYDEIEAELRDEAVIWDGQSVPGYLADRGLHDLDQAFRGSFWFGKKRHGGAANVVFEYWSKDPGSGSWRPGAFERKNHSFKSVCKDAASSGFWRCETVAGRAAWLIGENPINCMSWNAIERREGRPTDGWNYAGLRSGGEIHLIQYIQELCARGDAPTELVFIADNDPQGWDYASKVARGLAKETKEHGIPVRMLLPPAPHNDFNDYLRSLPVERATLDDHLGEMDALSDFY
jgi:hypothetical protein